MSPLEPANGEYSTPAPIRKREETSWYQPNENVAVALLVLLDVVETGIDTLLTDSVLLSWVGETDS